jgi:hypothetical protein
LTGELDKEAPRVIGMSENKTEAQDSTAEYIPWRILPPGEHPFPHILKYCEFIKQSKSTLRIATERLELINSLNPSKIYRGLDEFNGYFVFYFEDSAIAILDCPIVGNAVYVIKGDWKTLSSLSKDGNALVNNPKHQDIQRGLAELPVAAVQSQHPRRWHTDQRHQQRSDEGIAELEEAQEALNAFVVRFGFGATRKNRGDHGEVDGANLDQSDEKLGQEVDAGFIPSYIFSKGSLKRANVGDCDLSFQDSFPDDLAKDSGTMAFMHFQKSVFVMYTGLRIKIRDGGISSIRPSIWRLA